MLFQVVTRDTAEQLAWAFEGFDSEQDLLSERELVRALKVSRTTLWRLRAQGLPAVQLGRLVRYDLRQVREWLNSQRGGIEVAEPRDKNLPPCHWAPSVAFDPKHRPQQLDLPSSTVRREWWRFPQEAHLLDTESGRYRRLRADEMAVLQGFPPEWGQASDLSELDLMRGFGDAVPPALAQAVCQVLARHMPTSPKSVAEVCAGFGGMALGAQRALGLEHAALIERWSAACSVLRTVGCWRTETIFEGDVRQFDWSGVGFPIDILSGGPPCQPWSMAGQRMGSLDERDLLGHMPELLDLLQPAAFVFENVPGLIMGDNTSYARWLVDQLRSARPGYGVALGILQAADFGVPQRRRRVFIIGLRGAHVAEVHKILDDIHASRTHGNPRLPLDGRRRWRTIREALPSWDDPSHQWRRWILPPERASEWLMESDENIPSEASQRPTDRPRRIELSWPGRDDEVHYSDDGWRTVRAREPMSPLEIRPLVQSGERRDPLHEPWVIEGDPLDAIEALHRIVGHRSDLIYVDAPRIQTNAAKFDAADPQTALNTWLSLMYRLLRSALNLAAESGVLTVLAGFEETPYIQILLNEIAGPNNQIGTVVWQKRYSAQNLPNMRDITPGHDNIVVFARRKGAISPVALSVEPSGYRNPDNDPRGPWKAEQKGANKPDYNYEINIPPYRWRIVDGTLPPGIWRINPKSGVLWGRAEDIASEGIWSFVVEVEDSEGQTVRQQCTLSISDSELTPSLAEIPWLTARSPNAQQSPEPLRIVTSALPSGRLNHEYSACLAAAGGRPWTGTTRPGKNTASGRDDTGSFRSLHWLKQQPAMQSTSSPGPTLSPRSRSIWIRKMRNLVTR